MRGRRFGLFVAASAFALAVLFFSNIKEATEAQAGRNATYNAGGFTFGSTQQLVPTILTYGLEPEIKTDIFGNIYVTQIQGVGGGGLDLFKSTDKGATFTFMGKPDGAGCPQGAMCTDGAGIGGGDDSIDVSSGGYLYVSSLWAGSDSMSVSQDGGFTWTVSPGASDVPLIDRQWVAAYGPQTVYNAYAQIVGLDAPAIYVSKSNDNGKTFPQVAQVNDITQIRNDRQGNTVVDQYNGNVYLAFVPQQYDDGTPADIPAEHHTPAEVWFAKSTDGGATWTLKKAYQGPPGTDNRHSFPIMAADHGGNLHLVFGQCLVNAATQARSNCQILMTNSSDQGTTWLDAVRVNNGPDNNTAIFPWVVAGSTGVVDITWIASSATTPDANGDWHLFFTQTRDALSASPTFNQVQAIPQVIHNESVCFRGLDCDINGGNRDLAEYYSMTIDPDGNANIAFSDDVNNSLGGLASTWYTKQASGLSAYAPPASPAPSPAIFAPSIFVDTTGRTGAEPNVKVDSNNNVYVAAIGVSGAGSGPGVWKSTNGGTSFSFLGKFANGPGSHGGDADIVPIPKLTPSASPDHVYLSDLGLTTIHIGKSTDGTTFPAAPGASAEANASADRMWFAWDRAPNLVNAAQCDQTVFLNDHELASETIRVGRSTNDGPWLLADAITDPELAQTLPNTNTGNIFVDRRMHVVYTVFAASTNETNALEPPFGNLLNVYIAVSTDGGITWTNHPVHKGLLESPPTAPAEARTFGTNNGNIFAAGDVDRAGNVYVVWGMNSARTNQFDIWYSVSRDQGKNFYGPVRVNTDAGTHVLPWIAAGDAGKVDLVWYGTSTVGDPNTLPTGANAAQWNMFFAQTLNGSAREPVFTSVQAGDHVMHRGAISTGGLLGSSDRSLLDFFQVALDTNGLAHIAYADNGGSGGAAKVAYTHQTAGPNAGQAYVFEPLPCTVGATCTPTNFALAANGGTASASSTYSARNYSPAGANDGERAGANWEQGGGWNDDTRDLWPDSLQIDFNGSKTINEIRVYTVQNNFTQPVEPDANTPADLYGLLDFDVQFFDGNAWVTVPGGAVTGNDRAMRRFTFPDITTMKIRVVVSNARVHFSRITEVEATGCPPGGQNSPLALPTAAPVNLKKGNVR